MGFTFDDRRWDKNNLGDEQLPNRDAVIRLKIRDVLHLKLTEEKT